MKFFVASIFIGLVATALAHPPAAVSPVEEKSVAEKPITEASTEKFVPTEASKGSSSNNLSINSIDKKLPVKIYYEGLCPDSRKLLSDLGREYYSFRKYIDLMFVPFGRAESLDANGNKFKCHHGPKEGVANRVHSCGAKYLKSQDAKQQFVVCQMRTEADQTGKECLEEAGGDWAEVSKCIDGEEGKNLQLAAVIETKEISKPRLENVPTIVFNNKYDSELNNKALKGLKSVLCDMLSSKNIPDCA